LPLSRDVSAPDDQHPDDGGVRRLVAVVRGRVQGVGFRYTTSCEARRLGLAGWVVNRMDGSVEVRAEGRVAALRELERFVRAGPRGARVTGVDIFWEAAKGDLVSFEIR
jgi:acylphosphatase